MDTPRISIARILALDVPLTWQDAVAVAQEVAMLSDVNAAMNTRPSLVSPDSCFITRGGDVELPITTDVESPDAVSMLLREMLAGREAPDELESLAFDHAIRDVSGALERFPIPSRRAAIAKVATRAFALESHFGGTLPAQPVPKAAAPPSRLPAVVPTSPASVAGAAAPVVPDPPAAIGVIAAELRRLRLKTLAASLARSGAGARVALGSASRRVRWIAAACVATVLASGVWVATGVSRTGEAAITVDTHMVPAIAFARAVPQVSPARLLAAETRVASGFGKNADPSRARSVAAPPVALATSDPPATLPRFESRSTPVTPVALDAAAGETPPALPAARGTVPAPVVNARDRATAPLTGDRAPVNDIATRGSVADDAEERVTLFSANDPEVSPPVFRRQQVPSSVFEPGTAVPEGWPYLDLIVDQQGAVENVRLTALPPAPGQSLYRQRMLVAAAKAWQFEPARRNGKPVRYAIRVPLEP